MQKIIIAEGSTNYDDDQKIATYADVMDIAYLKEDDQSFVSIDIAQDDHYITLNFDRDQFMQAVVQVLVDPEDA